ncbi:MAG: chemotaxis protein CheW [Endozoicomonadaceae bacterium]|nr:chemotaxis protein CheW [Endozoicomonadaceae bacterium]
MTEEESSGALIQTDADREKHIDTCWKRIGVWAKDGATCTMLQEVIHCRNCPTYVQAGRQCLSGHVLENTEEMQEISDLYRQPKTKSEQGLQKVTLFRLGKEWFALDASIVRNILRLEPCCWVPHRSSVGIKGIANIDGDALVVVSLDKLLGVNGDAAQKNESTEEQGRVNKTYPRMITLGNTGKSLVVEVDEVWGQAKYSSENIMPLPSTVSQAVQKYSIGLLEMKGKLVGLLDATLLLYGLEQAMK